MAGRRAANADARASETADASQWPGRRAANGPGSGAHGSRARARRIAWVYRGLSLQGAELLLPGPTIQQNLVRKWKFQYFEILL